MTRCGRASSTASTPGSSGLLVVARTEAAARNLVAQFSAHTAGRRYDAVVWGHPDAPHGIVDAPIGRDPSDPLRMAVVVDGKPARTEYEVTGSFAAPSALARLTCRLQTGRTHQIRVHLAAIGHPLVGDTTYGDRRPTLGLVRPFLHAAELSFDHPTTGERQRFESPLPDDLASFLATLTYVGVPGHAADAGRSLAGARSLASARWQRRLGGVRPGGVALGHLGDHRQRVAVEMVAHVLAGPVPDGDQHALPLVVARPVLVRLTEVAERDRPVDRRDDLRQADLRRRPGEDVAAADAPLRAHEAGTLEGEQDLLQVGLGQSGAVGDVADRRRPVAVGVEGQGEQRPAGVVTPGRDAHADHGTQPASALPATAEVVDSAAVTPEQVR